MKSTLLLISIFLSFQLNIFSAVDTKQNNDATMDANAYDILKNEVSKFEFYLSNYGIFFNPIISDFGGGIYPRGSQNSYIFGAGHWFATIKPTPGEPEVPRKYVEVSYNPNNGRSWMVSGRIEDGDNLLYTNDAKKNYRIYNSLYYIENGNPFNHTEYNNWPLWRTQATGAMGKYVKNPSERNHDNYPLGPVFVSDEDFFFTYKDTEVSQYDGGEGIRRSQGYPLNIQYESRVLTWDTQEGNSSAILVVDVINLSNEDRTNCWFGFVFDPDIVKTYMPQEGAKNDLSRYLDEYEELNTAIAWTNYTQGEDTSFKYVSFSLIHTPAVDAIEYVIQESNYQKYENQLGMTTMRNWRIEDEGNIETDEQRYNAMSQAVKETGIDVAGDVRLLMVSGPFNLRIDDRARFAVLISFSDPYSPNNNDELRYDGISDLDNVINNVQNGIDKYYNSVLSVEDDNILFSNDEVFSIFPNPAKEYAHISFNRKAKSLEKISVFDILGNELFSVVLNDNEMNNGVIVPLKNISTGMYNVVLKSEKGIYTKKLIVN